MFTTLKVYTLSILMKLRFNHKLNEWDLYKHPLTWKDWQIYFICLLMAMPTIIMFIFLQGLKNIWASIVLFHISCLVGSFLYIIIYQQSLKKKIKSGLVLDRCNHDIISHIVSSINDDEEDQQDSPTTPFISHHHQQQQQDQYSIANGANTLSNHSSSMPQMVNSKWYKTIYKALSVPQQYAVGSLILISGVGIGLMLYYLISQYTPTVVINMEQYGLLRYVYLINFFFTYFCIINPIVEEWFWRMFLENVYGSRIIDKIVINFFYAIYHFVVLLVFFEVWISLAFVVVVFIGGLFFSFITKFVGPAASIFSHIAADTLIILFIAYGIKYPYNSVVF